MTVSGLSLNMNNFRNFVPFVIILGIFFVFLHLKNNVPVGEEFIQCIQQYEKDVTSKR